MLIVTVLVVPIVVAVVRTLAGGYYPVSDNALLALRAGDTFSAHPPLLGASSSASSGLAESVSHPGPWYGYLVAAPVRVLGPAAGSVVGVAVVNAVAVMVAAGQGRAVGGRVGLGAMAVAVGSLLVGMGPNLMWDIWQPHALLLPFVAFVASLWAVVGSTRGRLALVVGIGSLLAQTHLTYVVLAGTGMAVAVAITLGRWRRGPEDGRASVGRQVLAAAGVLVIAWAPTVIEQFTGAGRGNLGRLLARDMTGASETLGWARAVRAVGTQVLRPWFTRDGFSEGLYNVVPVLDGSGRGGLVGAGAATLAVAGVVIVLGAVAVVGHRQGDRVARAAGAVGLGLLALTVATAQLVPFGSLGIAAHQLRFISPVLASGLGLAIAGGVRLASDAAPSRRITTMLVGFVVALTAVVAVLPYAYPAGPAYHGTEVDGPARAVAEQLAAADVAGPVRYDDRYFYFGEYYVSTVLLALARDGVDVRAGDEITIRQLGEHRRADGSERGVITVAQGEDALATPPGAERIAFVQNVTADVADPDEFLDRTVAVFYEPAGDAGDG